MISVKGEAKPLSYDHKPQNESAYASNPSVGRVLTAYIPTAEKNRIVAAGGYIEYGRVNGSWVVQSASLSPELLCR